MKTATFLVTAGIFLMQGTTSLLPAANAVFSPDGSSVTRDSRKAINLWLGKNKLKDLKPEAVRRSFMHGVTDHQATPISWTQLFQSEEEAKPWIHENQILKTAVKQSNFPILTIRGQKNLLLQKPVLGIKELETLKGKTLRFFVWMQGENCGKARGLWEGAPVLTFTLKDSLNNVIATEESLFKTRGTFPWFCYYVDVPIPASLHTETVEAAQSEENPEDSMFQDLQAFAPSVEEIREFPAAGGLYLSVGNPGGGNVSFSTLSWQVVQPLTDVIRKTWTDPTTGSNAPNPDYDELPMHFFFGVNPEKEMAFLRGNQVYGDLTTQAGLEEYFTTATNDWFHLQYGLARLGYLHKLVSISKTPVTFEEGWEKLLGEKLVALQNESTGFWGTTEGDNLMVTHAIVTGCFSPKSLPRTDLAQEETPWNSVNGQSIPNAGLLLNTLLNARLKGTGGVVKGWNRYIFQPAHLGAEQRNKTSDLAATSVAVQILAQIVAQTQDEEEKVKAQTAIRDAWKYALTHFVTPNYLWKQDDFSASVTSSAFFFPLLEATGMLEPKFQEERTAPAVTAEKQGLAESYRVTWTDKGKESPYNAIRIYAAPDDVEIAQLTEAHLVAILSDSTRTPLTADPLHNLIIFSKTAAKRWEISPASEGAEYLAKKLASLSPKLVTSESKNEILFTMPKPKEGEMPVTWKYYVSGVTAYGEMSVPVPLPSGTTEQNAF